ncbi:MULTISPECIES: class I SAM-dependent methyltransferase [Microcystis]|uniref:class I SAM-dependent methyltransferase n=1 Tax=Microcystis TaxID=1125 RepID=UPI0022476570|nr:class I SAM-dependent methyltransferase [Microcystis aeruginosa]
MFRKFKALDLTDSLETIKEELTMKTFQEEELHQSKIFDAWAERDYLQSTIDPNDTKGLKCDYINKWSEYYVKKYIVADQKINVLDIGCGSGRNLFMLSPYIKHGYGIDIAEKQIQNAKAWKDKFGKENTSFYTSLDEFLADANDPDNIDVVFTMWVVAGFSRDENLKLFLSQYLQALPRVKKFVFFEQTALETYTVNKEGGFFKKVRTKGDFQQIFSEVGLEIKDFKVINEKGFGPLYRLFFFIFGRFYNYYPTWLWFKINRLLFWFDRHFVKREIKTSFTDCVFVCERY